MMALRSRQRRMKQKELREFMGEGEFAPEELDDGKNRNLDEY